MNYLFFSKKLTLLSGYLNLLSSLGWIFLIITIGLYHNHIIRPTGNHFYPTLPTKSFHAQPFENLEQGVQVPVTAVQATHNYVGEYISEHGYGSFFSETIKPLGIEFSFWTVIQPIFILSIIFSSLNLFLSIFTSFLSFKARSFNYLVCSISNLFLPLYGFWLTLQINRKMKSFGKENLNNKKIVSPSQWIKLRTKLALSKTFSEVTIPA